MEKRNLVIFIAIFVILVAIMVFLVYSADNENTPPNYTNEPGDYMSDGVSIYKNLNTNEMGCFGCGNKMCVDILIDGNVSILNETEDMYCNNDFQIVRGIKVKSDFGNKIVYDFADGLREADYQEDCTQRGGTFNSCGSVCAPDAQICVMVCGFTCENLN